MITKQQRPLQVNSIHRPFFFVKCASRQARVSFSSFISPEFNSGSKHRSLRWMSSNKGVLCSALPMPSLHPSGLTLGAISPSISAAPHRGTALVDFLRISPIFNRHPTAQRYNNFARYANKILIFK